MADDDVIQSFPVGPFQGTLGSNEGDVGSVQIVRDISPFLDTGDLLKFFD
jgi:hypothetical protein